MGWTSPLTWVVAQIVTAANMNTHIRDNLNYLKGVNQVPTIESGLIIDNTGGDEYVKLPLLSTAEANSVLNAEGKIAFDETTHQLKLHNGTAVKAVISEADVDDTPVNGADTVPVSSNWAYDLKAILTTRGDVIRRGASDWERVALGTSGQYLSSNGTDVVWAAGTHVANTIVIWAGTIANIPAGFVICDGNNGTPNLLTRFLEGVATAATNPGTTGGATAKTTGVPSATTIVTPGSGGNPYAGDATHTHSITDIRPLYYDVAFIMKT